MDIKKFGLTLKMIRSNKQLSGKALCEKCDNILTPQQLSNIELGHQ